MTRLLIHVEGQTEETFVNAVLGPHLYKLGYSMGSVPDLTGERPSAQPAGRRSSRGRRFARRS